MRELRSCDFCGGDAAGVYEPLPPELAAEQRRVALCPECRDTLAGLLEPLGETDGRDAPDGAGGEPPSGDRTARAVTVEPADRAGDDAETRGENEDEADSDSAPTTGPATGGQRAAPPVARADTGS